LGGLLERERIYNMKKYMIFVVALCLLCLLVSCGGNGLTAPLPMPTSAPKLSLDDFQNREFVGENDNYSVYW
jgi:hypothetical protein